MNCFSETHLSYREILKSRLKVLAFSSFKTCNSFRKPSKLKPEEFFNCEQKVIDILKEIKNKNQINGDLYNKLRSVGSQPRVLYGLAKLYKNVIDGGPAFRSIL